MKWNRTQKWATTSTDPGLDRGTESRPARVEKAGPPRSSTCENSLNGERTAYSTMKGRNAKTTKCSTAWSRERRKKQRKRKEEMDGQCKRRLGRKSDIQLSTAF